MQNQNNIFFNSNAHYDEKKKVWIVTYIVDGNTMNHYFQSKPKWIESIDNMNDILKKNSSPRNLRKIHDNIEEISLNSFDKYKYRFSNNNLEKYLKTLEKKDLIDAKKIFDIKKTDEELSCTHGGSMPSSKCGTMWRLSLITKQLERRIKSLSWFSIPLFPKNHILKDSSSKGMSL